MIVNRIRKHLAFLLFIGLVSCQTQTRDTFRIETVDYVKLNEEAYLEVATVADGLHVPWGMDYVDNKIVFTEITGTVKQLDLATGVVSILLKLEGVFHKRTPGLLDIAIQKTGETDPYVVLNYTTEEGEKIVSNLVRYTYTGDTLKDPKKLLAVRGYLGHNGARVIIDDRDIIYWATGDVADNTQAQDSTTLNGKILRLDMDGGIPADNPIPGSYVYAWGFRNMQGLTMDGQGNIFTSEHGDAIEDEINLIRPLHNYGWPLAEGIHDTPEELAITDSIRLTEPIRSWTPVVAPAGLAYYEHSRIPEWKNTLLLGTLKSQTLRVLSLNEDHTAISGEKVYFSDRYGRIRDVLAAPNGDVYISTSNRDWNPQPGFPLKTDDRILRIRTTSDIPGGWAYIEEDVQEETGTLDGAALYKNYCASCHKPDGLGIAGNFPPLKGSRRINNTAAFIGVLLNGTDGKEPIGGVRYNQPMASFSFLKDEELSAIINYVNTEFGNGRLIQTKEVTNHRTTD
ncbi:PQQ-dependent sugar dehydrogenase [Sinomicrobium weinanense]|uniref:PQQ-dependent sugar dehydrogenase n=1 Tax=Sinomicrobium weinanense TaxID=2842200 RepID=A0A926Q471_9FLAO|nr:PQQ-dependent sugar dehydrogenase [Sinomicrobium weinanense]MBC9796766.1 PQQ-dependent sugar dehydrogenase [Sinomicrobium weinanense]MBU3125547.1 PQQ-dependent sugar dehydrogenase [Sinomicrobium weinanense]